MTIRKDGLTAGKDRIYSTSKMDETQRKNHRDENSPRVLSQKDDTESSPVMYETRQLPRRSKRIAELQVQTEKYATANAKTNGSMLNQSLKSRPTSNSNTIKYSVSLYLCIFP